jgi:predicted enzyme related to lactoylglutathione lyase
LDPLPGLAKPGAVVFVADVPSMTQFYQELATMALVHRDVLHAILERAGFQLVIHARTGAPDSAPLGHPHVREKSPIKVCLPVESIAAARTTAARLGGAIQPASNEWEARGVRACDGYDPEGNVLQVRCSSSLS